MVASIQALFSIYPFYSICVSGVSVFQEFMEDSGAMEFNRFGFSAGLSFMTRSYDDYLDMCRAVNATLASPRNYEDFQVGVTKYGCNSMYSGYRL